MISNKSYYGIISLVYMATKSKGKHVGLREIATTQGIPLRFLEQIFARLKGSGIVSSVRGAGGGYRLAIPSETLTLAEIMTACEGKSEFATNSGVLSRSEDRSPVGRAFVGIVKSQLAKIRVDLEQISLNDLIREAGVSAEMYYI